MVRVVWTQEASDRLAEIVAYIAQDSPENALRVERAIIQASRRMETFPFAGGVVEDLHQYDVREIYYDVYRILYVVKEDASYIVCVIHGSRDLLSNVNPEDWVQ